MTDKFTQKTLEALQSAQGMAIENENMQIAPEHLVYALADQDGGLIGSLLGKMGVDTDRFLASVDEAVANLPKVSGSGREPDKVYILSLIHISSVRQITPEILYQSHAAFYRPRNMCLTVVGDFDRETVYRAVDRAELPQDVYKRQAGGHGRAQKAADRYGSYSRHTEPDQDDRSAGRSDQSDSARI